MLKVKLKATVNKTNYNEVKFDEIGVSSDLISISATCDSSYNLNDLTTVLLKTNKEVNGFERIINVKPINAIGTFIDDNKTYYITSDTIEGENGIIYNIYKKDVYDEEKDDIITIVSVDKNNNGIITPINNVKSVPCQKSLITFPIKLESEFYVKNANCATIGRYVKYDEKYYDLEFLEFDDETNDRIYYTIIDDTTSGFTKMFEENGGNKTEIAYFTDNDTTSGTVLYKYDDNNIGEYIKIYVEDYPFEVRLGDYIEAVNTEDNSFKWLSNFSGDTYGIFYNNKVYEVSKKDETTFNYVDCVVIGEKEYEITYTSDSEGFIDIDGITKHVLITNDVEVIKNKYKHKELTLNLSCVEYEDKSDFTLLSENEKYFDVTYNTNNETYRFVTYSAEEYGNYYVYLNRNDVSISVNYGNTSTIDILQKPIYGLKRYKYIEIDGVKYKVKNYNSKINVDVRETSFNEYVELSLPTKYKLQVIDIIGRNVLLCQPVINYDTTKLTFNFIPFTVTYEIKSSIDDFSFKLLDEKIEYLDYNGNILNGEQIFEENNLHFYKELDYLNVPIFATQNEETNINQSDLLEKLFKSTEVNNAINDIVDMDKEVYYPYYSGKTNNETTYSEINTITFNLHFRTRDLSIWKINEDYSKVYDGNDAENAKIVDTNWNCIDYYNETIWSASCINSDLLYFLNLTDNDVFYQKSNIKMSFIRLLFFDTRYPSTQSLLYQATVWLDGSKLFKKYINNLEDKSYYNFETGSIVKNISVANEPLDANDEDKPMSFNEDERLDCKFTISNRYETNSSAEGFYLHLYKNLLEGVCDKTIYMKVIFNHAGVGKSSLMSLPMIEKDGTFKLVDFEDTNDIEIMKNGVPLKNIFETTYIPLHIQYNDELKKHIYSFDDAFIDKTTNEVNFNLFEIKVKDESN